jgi:hypothetical protein
MLPPGSLASLLHDNADIIILTLIVIVFIMLLAYALLLSRLAKLNRLYRRLTQGTSGGNIEEILREYMGTVENVSEASRALKERLDLVAKQQLLCLQRVGVVRFDAFEEVGGEQSFAVVVLDSERNGFALSSVYSRSDVRVYAKHISKGQPSHPLTKEEERALLQAEGRTVG